VSKAEVRGSQKGFTLIEIAIALGIVSIVAMLAVPSFISIMPRLQLNSNTVTMANEIALARASAIAKSGEYGVRFNPASNSYSLGVFVYDGGAGTWDFSSFATSSTSRNVDFYKAVTWDPAPSPDGTETNASMLALRAVGSIGTRLPANDPGFVPLDFDQAWRLYLKTTDGAYHKRVVLKAVGRIYAERLKGSAWVED
jgi:prepilin-type N-terminal cleavage/methylation domain-containing protein